MTIEINDKVMVLNHPTTGEPFVIYGIVKAVNARAAYVALDKVHESEAITHLTYLKEFITILTDEEYDAHIVEWKLTHE